MRNIVSNRLRTENGFAKSQKAADSLMKKTLPLYTTTELPREDSAETSYCPRKYSASIFPQTGE